jgi:hypothetical protein
LSSHQPSEFHAGEMKEIYPENTLFQVSSNVMCCTTLHLNFFFSVATAKNVEMMTFFEEFCFGLYFAMKMRLNKIKSSF